MINFCPKCSTKESKGFLHGPNKIRTSQGYIFVIECVNCGWFLEKDDWAVIFKNPVHNVKEEISVNGDISNGMRQYIYRTLNKL